MSNVTANPTPLKFVDFHSHYVGPSFALTTLAGVAPAQRRFWEGVNCLLSEWRKSAVSREAQAPL